MVYSRKGLNLFPLVVSLVLIGFLVFLAVDITLSSGRPSRAILPPLQLGPQSYPFIFVLAVSILLVAFVNTDMALIILIFSMLLSPEIKLAEVPQRAVVVRVDDVLLFVVFFGWLAKLAVNKELALVKRSGINHLIAAYIGVCIVSTLIGVIVGKVSMLKSMFYILKYVEYFMLYFLVSNNIRDKRQIKTFMAAFLFTGIVVCIYAITQIGALARTTAPFEGVETEPNTLAGYLLILFAVCTGIFLYSRSLGWRVSSAAIGLFSLPAFIFTLSRSSYLAFIPMYCTFIFFVRRKRLFLIGFLILGIILGPMVLPRAREAIINRIERTFGRYATRYGVVISEHEVEILGRRIPLDYSTATRFESYKNALRQWLKRPFLGHGVTGVGLVDSQYPRILGETGLVGFSFFILLLMVIFRRALLSFKTADDDFMKGIALGFLAALIGLSVQAFGANTFIIVRIMEPFWFLAAVVMVLPDLAGDRPV